MNMNKLPPATIALRYLIEINNLNTVKLSAEISVSNQVISRWCKGMNIKHKDMVKLCKFFRLPEWEFIKLGTDMQEKLDPMYSEDMVRTYSKRHIDNEIRA